MKNWPQNKTHTRRRQNSRTLGGQYVRRPVSTKFKAITTLRVEVCVRPSVTPKRNFTVMNIEMSQAQKNKWSRTSCEGLFQVGMKAHLHHKTPALHTFILLQNKSPFPLIQSYGCLKLTRVCSVLMNAFFTMKRGKYVHRDSFRFHAYFFWIKRI